jgi:(1->4)-alpha-D-glucan 1-alpha-D-glucosylmutase
MKILTVPRATARLQFHAGFTLDDAVPVIPYLAALGASHLYASPILKARPGSTHGYDIVDHNQINPELGGMPALERLVATLRAHGMGLLLDIVPNHMGVGGADNAWWLDVLENGHNSRYAEFFDIDWSPPDAFLHNRLLAPFLGAAYGDVLKSGELVLKLNEETGALFVEYHEHVFPLSPVSAAAVLRGEPGLDPLALAFAEAAKLVNRTHAARAVAAAKASLAAFAAVPENAALVARCLAPYAAGTPAGERRLHELLQRQNYRLAWWRAATDEINWRRFFDINTLAGVRVEIPRVFDATHEFILKLYAQGLIDGVRIDHIDGLADPRGYARKLRRVMARAGAHRPGDAPKGAPYIVVEKILNGRERLPADWLTDGTTGYDFMDQVSAVLHDPAGAEPLALIWASLTGRPDSFEAEEVPARRQILANNLASELFATAAALHRIARRRLETRDYTLTGIRRGLAEILVHFPVYRIYAGPAGLSDADVQVMDRALAAARRSFRAADAPLLALLRDWLADTAPRALPPGAARTERGRAQVKFQQLSAPTAAKSVEDTAFYRYGRLLSRNEVGSHPGMFAISPAAFHAEAEVRGTSLPGALLATATHDHKRGEDTRVRLAVLSEIPAEWEAALTRWMRLNNLIRQEAGPSPADEIMLYQMIVAAWPLGLAADDAPGLAAFAERLAAWQEKAVREAKLVSEWAAPNEVYEAAAKAFLHNTLDPARSVLADIAAFATRLGAPGAINGLAQTLLRLTAPGVPDLYQGTEFWDQSLVDPDNRRPVDFPAREAALAAAPTPVAALTHWQDGQVKQAIIARALHVRAQMPGVFAHGTYQRIEAQGELAPHVLAFSRSQGGRQVVAVVTRLAAAFVTDMPLVPATAWADTTLTIGQGRWENVLTGEVFSGGAIKVASMLGGLPVALLRSR